MKEREVKIEEIEELFFKLVIVSTYEMVKFEQKEMKQIRPIKNTWYDWLINYIPEPIRKSVGDFKTKIVILFKTLKKNCVWERKESKQTKNTKH